MRVCGNTAADPWLFSVIIKVYVRLDRFVFTYDLFHPHHVIPVSEFVTAFAEFANSLKSEMFVKFNAVARQIFVFGHRTSDTGI